MGNKYAIYVNTKNKEDIRKFILKAKREGIIEEDVTENSGIYNKCLVSDRKIFVSSLCLEMHYPKHEENLIYLNDYIRE